MSEREIIAKVLSSLAGNFEIMASEIREAIEELSPEVTIPKLDLGDLEQLPWTSYKTKEKCKEGEAGWIFANTQGADELVKAIKGVENEKLELGEYLFQLSGKEKQFISRRPLKRSSNPHVKMDQSLRNIRSATKRMGLQ